MVAWVFASFVLLERIPLVGLSVALHVRLAPAAIREVLSVFLVQQDILVMVDKHLARHALLEGISQIQVHPVASAAHLDGRRTRELHHAARCVFLDRTLKTDPAGCVMQVHSNPTMVPLAVQHVLLGIFQVVVSQFASNVRRVHTVPLGNRRVFFALLDTTAMVREVHRA